MNGRAAVDGAVDRSEVGMPRRSVTANAVIAGVAAFSFALGWRIAPEAGAAWFAPAPEPREVVARPPLPAKEASVIDVFEASRDSVVAISVAGQVMNPWTRSAVEVPRGSGSGFVWDGAGHVVTNFHVVRDASRAQVTLADGRSFPAELVGSDPSHDLAVLKIPVGPDGPSPLPLGTSADLRVGQAVLAIGNPFGLDWTLTTGIVSALDRELNEPGGVRIEGLIQTDAAINPGNSGGPLIDSAGRLIGVNTAIYSPSGSNAGIGFAVPVDVLNRVVPQIIANGRYVPPGLGIVEDERVNALARRSGLEGVLVLGTEPGSPAEKAGLRPATRTRDGRIVPGDVVTAVAGEPVGGTADLNRILDARQPGDEVEVEILRDGRRMVLNMTVMARA